MGHLPGIKPFGKIAGDELDPLSESSRGRCRAWIWSQPDAANTIFQELVASSAFIVVQSFQTITYREKSSKSVDR